MPRRTANTGSCRYSRGRDSVIRPAQSVDDVLTYRRCQSAVHLPGGINARRQLVDGDSFLLGNPSEFFPEFLLKGNACPVTANRQRAFFGPGEFHAVSWGCGLAGHVGSRKTAREVAPGVMRGRSSGRAERFGRRNPHRRIPVERPPPLASCRFHAPPSRLRPPCRTRCVAPGRSRA